MDTIAERVIVAMINEYGHNWTCGNADVANVAAFLETGNADFLGNWHYAHFTIARVAYKMGQTEIPGYPAF